MAYEIEACIVLYMIQSYFKQDILFQKSEKVIF